MHDVPPSGGCFVTHVPEGPHAALQHVAALVHAVPSDEHGVVHLPPEQTPRQHCESAVHATPCAKHVSLPKLHRSVSLLHSLQQPRLWPELQSSPVGRQSAFTRSI